MKEEASSAASVSPRPRKLASWKERKRPRETTSSRLRCDIQSSQKLSIILSESDFILASRSKEGSTSSLSVSRALSDIERSSAISLGSTDGSAALALVIGVAVTELSLVTRLLLYSLAFWRLAWICLFLADFGGIVRRAENSEILGRFFLEGFAANTH